VQQLVLVLVGLETQIFHFTTSSTLYNYADDNTLAHADDNIDKVVEHLEKDSGHFRFKIKSPKKNEFL
jgi:hypothetical protein